MARTINKVELLGRVGTDPEMKYTTGGTAVVQLRLATERRRQDGEVEADWHNVVCWSKTAEAVNQYVGKGDRIYVAGRLVQNTWEGDDGQRRYRTEITPPRLRGRVPRLQGRQRQRREGQRRRLGHRGAGSRLSLLVPQPHSDAFPKTHHGAAFLYRGRPRFLFQPITKEADMTKKTPTKDTALLDALRSNLNLLGEIAMRYAVETQPGRPTGDLPVISCPDDVRRLLGPEMAPLAQEQLRVLLLNTKNQVMGQRVIYQGNVSSAIVRTAEVFRPAVIEAVPSIIVSHNHPSQDPTPSPEDAALTRELVQAGKLLDIELLDHVVIGGERFVSLKERGLMS